MKNPILALLVTATIACFTIGKAQNYTPIFYYTFDDTLPEKDVSGNGNDISNGSFLNVQTGGAVGQYLVLDTVTPFVSSAVEINHPIDTAYTIEMWIKPSKKFLTATIFDYKMKILLDAAAIQLQTSFADGTKEVFTFQLFRLGRGSANYIYDGNWHHFASSYDVLTGETKLYIDGLSLEGFSQLGPPGMPLQNFSGNIFLSGQTDLNRFQGGIDELAVYGEVLPPEMIWQHYQEASQQGFHYASSLSSNISLPDVRSTENELSPFDFAPGYPKVPFQASELLYGYADPRYQTGHHLPPLFPWFSDISNYPGNSFGKYPLLGQTKVEVLEETMEVQKGLIDYFNNVLCLGPIGEGSLPSKFSNNTQFPFHITALAKDPDYMSTPRLIIGNWGQLRICDTDSSLNCSNAPLCLKVANINSSCSPPQAFVRNASGNIVWGKTWGPNAFFQDTCSYDQVRDSLLMADGNYTSILQNFYDSLGIGNQRIDYWGENGETLVNISDAILSLDSNAVKDRNCSQMSWADYKAARAADFRRKYISGFENLMTQRNLASGGDSLKWFWYNVAGKSNFRYEKASPSNHAWDAGYRRPTPFFYPQRAGRWLFTQTAITGMDDILVGRKAEIDAGDRIFNPAVSPGFSDGGTYNVKDEETIRPGQYLGLLKVLGMLGADTYTTFVYNSVSPPSPFFHAGNWRVWKYAMPGYAQAVTSKMEDLLYQGDLLPGDSTIFYGSTTNASGRFTLPTGNPMTMVVGRKLHGRNKYAICGTVQRRTNNISDGEKEKEACFLLADSSGAIDSMTIVVRQQGSVYILDLDQVDPVFYQLDGWHEWKDPTYWCKDFAMEAEVPDHQLDTSIVILTEKPLGTSPLDFREFTSYLSFAQVSPLPSPTVSYKFRPLESQDSLYVWARMRSIDGSNASLSFGLNGTLADTFSTSSQVWEWVNTGVGGLGVLLNVDSSFQSFDLRGLSGSLELDKIFLSTSSQPIDGSGLAVSIQGDTVCWGDSSRFVNLSSIPSNCAELEWDFGDGTISHESEPSHLYAHPGTYSVVLAVKMTCSEALASDTIEVLVRGPQVEAGEELLVCKGDSISLSGDAVWPYKWVADTALVDILDLNTLVFPQSTQYFHLVATDPLTGCSARDSVRVIVPEFDLSYEDEFFICGNDPVDDAEVKISGAYQVNWPSLGFISPTSSPFTILAKPSADTHFVATVLDLSGCLQEQLIFQIDVIDSNDHATITLGDTICEQDTLFLSAEGLKTISWVGNGVADRSSHETHALINLNDAATNFPAQVEYSISGSGCGGNSADTATTIVLNGPEAFIPVLQYTHCPGDSITIGVQPDSNATYSWTPTSSLSQASISNPKVSADIPISYTLTSSFPNGCQSTSSTAVSPIGIVPDSIQACPGEVVQLPPVTGADSVTWYSSVPIYCPDGLQPYITADSSRWYYVDIRRPVCLGMDSVFISVSAPITITTSDTSICSGDSVTLHATGGSNFLWSPSSSASVQGLTSTTVSPSGNQVFYASSCDPQDCFLADSVLVMVDSACCIVPNADTVFATAAATDLIAHFGSDTLQGLRLHVKDSLAIDADLHLIDCEVLLDSLAVIRVLNFMTLNSQGTTFDAACGIHIWKGIVVERLGSFISSNDSLLNARIGVLSLEGGELRLAGTLLEDCHTGVRLDTFAGAHVAEFDGCTFRGSGNGLLMPYSGVTNPEYGINVDTVFMAWVGDSLGGLQPNIFENLRIGVRFFKSNGGVFGNQFRAMPAEFVNGEPVGLSGTAVYCEGEQGMLLNNVYDAYIGAADSSAGNVFEEVGWGVESMWGVNLHVRENRFVANEVCGVLVSDAPFRQFYIRDNRFTDCGNGVLLTLTRGAQAWVENNLIESELDFARGVRVADVSTNGQPSNNLPTTFYRIAENTIDLAGTGVHVQTALGVEIEMNDIQMRGAALGIPFSTAIRVDGCLRAKVKDNFLFNAAGLSPAVNVNGNVVADTTLRGLFVQLTDEGEYTCNDIYHFGDAVTFQDRASDSYIRNNLIFNAENGMKFVNGVNVGVQGSTNEPNGNKWIGGFGYSQTWTINLTNGQNFPFWARNTSSDAPTNNLTDGSPGFQAQFPISLNEIGLTCEELDNGPGDDSEKEAIATKSISNPNSPDSKQVMDEMYLKGSLEVNPDLSTQSATLAAADALLSQGSHKEIYEAQEDLAEANATGVATNAQSILDSSLVMRNLQLSYEKLSKELTGGIQSLTASDQLELQLVADLCPSEGGPGVYHSRSILAGINPLALFSDVCGGFAKRKESNEMVKTLQFEVYPNPATGLVYVNLRGEAAEVLLMDAFGRTVAKGQGIVGQNDPLNLPLSHLAAGMYNLLIQQNGHTVQLERLVVE